MDGRQTAEKTLTEDSAHRDHVLKTGITKDQQINYVEAALIRYFQPIYNVRFKDQFPHTSHTSYGQCYDLDINSIAFEIETDDLKCRLYSEAAPRTWFHIKSYPLHDRKDRQAMFEMFSPTPVATPLI